MIELAEAFAALGTTSKVLETAIAMSRRMRCRVKILVLVVMLCPYESVARSATNSHL